MDNPSVSMRIGDHYLWGDSCRGKKTVIAGFFAGKDSSWNDLALTVAPPSEYRRNTYGCLEVVSSFICIASVPTRAIDRSEANLSSFDGISREIVPVKSKCTLIVAHGRHLDAVIASTNRTVIVDGTLCSGLYELSTKTPISGPSGAAVVCNSKLIALLLGTFGEIGGEWRSFAVSVSSLHSRFRVLKPIHESDREGEKITRNQFAVFGKTDRRYDVEAV